MNIVADDDFLIGRFSGELAFDLPAEEMKKLDAMGDFLEQAKAFTGGQGMSLKSLEVVKQVGDTQSKFKFELPKKEESQLTQFVKQVPILKDFYRAFSAGGAAGIGTAAAVLGAVGVLFMSGSGFKETLGALWDLLGMVSDLIYVSLFPVIKPLLESFVDFGKWLADHSHGPGGILGAFADPSFWAGAVGILLDGLVQGADQLAKLGLAILDGFADGLQNDPKIGTIFTNLGQHVGGLILDSATLAAKFAEFLATALTGPTMMKAWSNIGMAIAEGFAKGAAQNLAGHLQVTTPSGGKYQPGLSAALPIGGLRGGLGVVGWG